MNNNQIILSVPADLKFLETVENFVVLVSSLANISAESQIAFDLKVVLTEAFVNAVNYSKAGSAGQVEIVFDLQPDLLKIRVCDIGKGLPLEDMYPPYPQRMVGTTRSLLKTIDGEVLAHVENERTLSLSFKESELRSVPREKLLEAAKDGGMGLSFMTKLMDEVRFRYLGKAGNALELVKHLDGNHRA